MTKRIIALALLFGLGALFSGLLTDYRPDAELNLTARYYAERTAADIGAPNIVTAIVVTYRGLDTLGEVTVLFLASTIVGLVLARGRRKSTVGAPDQPPPPLWGRDGERGVESGIRSLNEQNPDLPPPTPALPHQGGGGKKLAPVGEMLATGGRFLTPLILLLGIYVFVNGHLTPGGGFQGGAILASGVLMLLMADPLKKMSHQLISAIESLAGLFYVAIGVAGLLLAGGFLDNRILPLGDFGALVSAGAIPVIYSLIGLKVGAEFSSMLADLSETEEL